MKQSIKSILAGAGVCALSHTAVADEVSNCELMLVQTVQIEAEDREAQIASYHSAKNFMISVTDDIMGHITQVGGVDIHGVLCERNEIIPAKSDYAILATGIPLVLSQNFDMQDTDSLTVKWIEGQFKYAYKGYPLSDEAETTLKARLAKFSEKGLNDWAIRAAKAKHEADAQAELDKEQDATEEPESADTDEVDTSVNTDAETLQIDEMDVTEIVDPDIAATEATKLHSQTKIETRK